MTLRGHSIPLACSVSIYPTDLKNRVGIHRVNAIGFLHFLERVPGHEIFDLHRSPAKELVPVDHGESFSVYFCDPYGNQLEVTTYQHAVVKDALSR